MSLWLQLVFGGILGFFAHVFDASHYDLVLTVIVGCLVVYVFSLHRRLKELEDKLNE